MTSTLQGSTALVTGATAGIGRAIARQLRALGAEVVVQPYNRCRHAVREPDRGIRNGRVPAKNHQLMIGNPQSDRSSGVGAASGGPGRLGEPATQQGATSKGTQTLSPLKHVPSAATVDCRAPGAFD